MAWVGAPPSPPKLGASLRDLLLALASSFPQLDSTSSVVQIAAPLVAIVRQRHRPLPTHAAKRAITICRMLLRQNAADALLAAIT